ncbi:RNA pseudouridine synthase [Lentilactobacillus parakefiri]|uniref:RNA pseudouridylate synthase n=1 Tax=Lentilactobacillus parakefiri TaxID=152332 RepID=A0A269YCV7_9LACO|nr:RluA family pseudouridine synthase [Lentilactobacillus parakefiri]PAK83377.1 RNA pseudouridine synthase [Lentilactobacillus parakefiri]PAL00576.1 RNA pseudouridine synthase [Lentilactobacillus parakefiri]
MKDIQWRFKETVPEAMNGRPLKTLLSSYWQLPKHLVYSIRHAKRVLVDGHYQPVNFPVRAGSQIQLTFVPEDFARPFPTVTADSAATVAILYEDNDLIVMNKHRGDKTHPNQPGEVGAAINHLAAYLATEGTVPYMIHRLDQETSGAIIFAKNPVVVPILVANIANKQIKRTYLAWVEGTDLPDQGTINFPIGRDPDDKRKRKANGPNAVSALTHYQVLRRHSGYSLLQVSLETGRTHQIRVHFAALGHPLVGDPLYNSSNGSPFLMLHSWKVDLLMPFTKQRKLIEAPLPDHFINFEQGLSRD